MRAQRIHTASRRGGFTLVEVIVAAAILVLMMTGLGLITNTSQSAYRSTMLVASADVRARRALTRIASELSSVGGSVIAPDPTSVFGTDTIQYQRATGVVGGAVAWSPTAQLGFEYAPGEANDGVDNDGDGVIDNGVVVLTLNLGMANQQRVVLCNGVSELADGEVLNGVDDNGNGVADESGLSIQRVGDVMIIRLCLEQRDDGNGTIVRTQQTSVRLRNIDL